MWHDSDGVDYSPCSVIFDNTWDSNLEIFSRNAFMNTDRKTKVTNDAMYILEHMNKFIGKAIGDSSDFPVADTPPIAGCERLIRVWTKANFTSSLKSDGDREVAYCFNNATHTVTFYPHIRTWPDTATEDLAGEALSHNVYDWNAVFDEHWPYVNANVTVCWNASDECGSVDNPRVKLDTRISMPSLSVKSNP